jgi:ATP-dependent RNA helicase RhlE
LTLPSFSDLGVASPLARALVAERHDRPTPIQRQAIPAVLSGRDLVAIAETGSGKTAAFVLPILQRLDARPATAAGIRALILAPTRELALQIGDRIAAYGRHLKLRHAVVLGGVGIGPQVKTLAKGVDVLVATPGRLLDLMGQGHVRFDPLDALVLDEADRMFDMGFIRDVRRIVQALPKKRQTLLFSATMPDEVAALAQAVLVRPIRLDIAPEARDVARIDQRVYFVGQPAKRDLLARLLADPALTRVLVFTRTKHGANKVAAQLLAAGVAAEALHGNKSQAARQRALEAFRAGRARVLVATDIAARGIDVTAISHVINFELPEVPECYVHRIGRTARAGSTGAAFSFCDPSERAHLKGIEALTGTRLQPVAELATTATTAATASATAGAAAAAASRLRPASRSAPITQPTGPRPPAPAGAADTGDRKAPRRRRRPRRGGPARQAA